MLVLTTYHTVSTEWRNGNGADTSILFKTRWKRIILDEGILLMMALRAIRQDANTNSALHTQQRVSNGPRYMFTRLSLSMGRDRDTHPEPTRRPGYSLEVP